MKKIIPFIMLSGIIAMSACGNKTAADAPQQDSVETTDTMATDSLGAAGQTKQTDQTAQAKPDAKSVEAGGTTITVGAPLAETLKKTKG